MAAEHKRLLKERDWWRALAGELGMQLHGWDGMPPAGASFLTAGGYVIQVPGALAQAIFDRLRKNKC